ncbi:helix-turn-helix domain-containing protein [Spirosoma pulveris]
MATITNPHYATMTTRFRQFRKHLGLSQSQFDEKPSIDQTTVSAI